MYQAFRNKKIHYLLKGYVCMFVSTGIYTYMYYAYIVLTVMCMQRAGKHVYTHCWAVEGSPVTETVNVIGT